MKSCFEGRGTWAEEMFSQDEVCGWSIVACGWPKKGGYCGVARDKNIVSHKNSP